MQSYFGILIILACIPYIIELILPSKFDEGWLIAINLKLYFPTYLKLIIRGSVIPSSFRVRFIAIPKWSSHSCSEIGRLFGIHVHELYAHLLVSLHTRSPLRVIVIVLPLRERKSSDTGWTIWFGDNADFRVNMISNMNVALFIMVEISTLVKNNHFVVYCEFLLLAELFPPLSIQPLGVSF